MFRQSIDIQFLSQKFNYVSPVKVRKNRRGAYRSGIMVDDGGDINPCAWYMVFPLRSHRKLFTYAKVVCKKLWISHRLYHKNEPRRLLYLWSFVKVQCKVEIQKKSIDYIKWEVIIITHWSSKYIMYMFHIEDRIVDWTSMVRKSSLNET